MGGRAAAAAAAAAHAGAGAAVAVRLSDLHALCKATNFTGRAVVSLCLQPCMCSSNQKHHKPA